MSDVLEPGDLVTIRQGECVVSRDLGFVDPNNPRIAILDTDDVALFICSINQNNFSDKWVEALILLDGPLVGYCMLRELVRL